MRGSPQLFQTTLSNACKESAGKIVRTINSRLHRYITLLDSAHNGEYSNSLDFLFDLSHFSDNVTFIRFMVTAA